MKRLKFFFVLPLFSLLFFAGCSSSVDEPVTTQETQSDLTQLDQLYQSLCGFSTEQLTEENKLHPKESVDLVMRPSEGPVNVKPTVALYEQTGPEMQHFTINAEEGAAINGRRGTLVVVPKNCFVDKNGDPVEGQVKIELKEVLTKVDIILSNVPTMSNGRMLETGGSFYVNATANGEDLEIADDKSIYVELPAINRNRNMRVFNGNMSSFGNMNWEIEGELANQLYTFPFELLALNIPTLSQEMYEKITDDANRHSYLATRAFEERIQLIEELAPGHNKTNEIIEFYVRNKDMNLAAVDCKLVNYFKELAMCEPYSLVLHDSHKSVRKAKSDFRSFLNQHITNDQIIKLPNIDFESQNAVALLEEEGFSATEAEEVLQHVANRKAILEQRAETGLEKKAFNMIKNRLVVTSPGWKNIDCFYMADILTSMTVRSYVAGNLYRDVFMMFKNVDAVITGNADKTGRYHIFNNIPKGEEVLLVGIGYSNGIPYIGIHEFTTGDKDLQEVHMYATNLERFEKQLNETTL
ncbi:MAG: hypothetical protein IH946_02325 [Bacteroidetes bacterium]|nr:hypothetical protein [Bacteroidota bacterium]